MGPERTRGTPIVCVQCKAKGVVSWRTDAAKNRRELDQLTPGFLCVDSGEPDDPHCQCAVCRVPVLIVRMPADAVPNP